MKQTYNSKSSPAYYKELGESKKDRNMSLKLFSSFEGWDTPTYLNLIEGRGGSDLTPSNGLKPAGKNFDRSVFGLRGLI